MITNNQEKALMRKFRTPESLLWVLKSFWIQASLEDIINVWTKQYIDNLIKDKRREWFRKTQTWEIKNKYTPVQLDDYFVTPINPVIGRCYHLSWSFRWAKFVLKKIDWDTVYLDNPKNKRDTLLKAKKSDLRLMRWYENHRQDELVTNV